MAALAAHSLQIEPLEAVVSDESGVASVFDGAFVQQGAFAVVVV